MWDVGPTLLAKLGQRKGTDTFINVLQTHPVHPPPCQSLLHRAGKKKRKVAEEWFRLKSMLIWSGIQRDFPVGSRTPLMPFWGGSFSSRCCSNYCWVCCLPSWSYPGIRAALSFWAMGLLTRILVLGVTGGRNAVRYGTGPWSSLGGPSWTWQTESSKLHGLPSPPLK